MIRNPEPWAFAVSILLFVGMIGLLEVGYRVAMWHAARDPELAHEGISVIEAGVFALLGLLLAFQLAGGLSRLDARRQLVINEASAISTAYSRIDLLPTADQPEMRRLFRTYLDTKLGAYEKFPDRVAAEQGMDRAKALEGELWAKVVASSRQNPDREAELLVLPTFSDLGTITTARKMALYTHQPPTVFALLIAMALLSAVLAGYAMAKRRRRSWLHLVIYPAVIALTVLVLLDLEYPRSGHVQLQATDDALYSLRDSIR